MIGEGEYRAMAAPAAALAASRGFVVRRVGLLPTLGGTGQKRRNCFEFMDRFRKRRIEVGSDLASIREEEEEEEDIVEQLYPLSAK